MPCVCVGAFVRSFSGSDPVDRVATVAPANGRPCDGACGGTIEQIVADQCFRVYSVAWIVIRALRLVGRHDTAAKRQRDVRLSSFHFFFLNCQCGVLNLLAANT